MYHNCLPLPPNTSFNENENKRNIINLEYFFIIFIIIIFLVSYGNFISKFYVFSIIIKLDNNVQILKILF